ncbi:MAG: hypothetical protein ACRCX4_02900 [Bacteroidales bacterium]
MRTIITYKSFFAYSEEYERYFYASFDTRVNIVTGKNTSGKSTLLQAINYTFGINDEKYKLTEILTPDLILRLDIEINSNNKISKATIVRQEDCVYIQIEGKPIAKFYGIKGNSSNEHIRLKKYYADLFNFHLELENKKNMGIAPIEVMFLPYYVSQNYGWVLILKSFSNLSYYKNFKTDYYDYYLGIAQDENRKEKLELEAKKQDIEFKIYNLNSILAEKGALQQALLFDEEYIEETEVYIEKYKEDKESLIKLEREYLSLANKIAYLERQKKTLKQIQSYLKKKSLTTCATCKQPLNKSWEEIYEYYQDKEDTEKQTKCIKDSIIKEASALNSKDKKIKELRLHIFERYNQFKAYRLNENYTLGEWIDKKVDIEIYNSIIGKRIELEKKLDKINDDLSEFLTEDEIIEIRKDKENKFKDMFYEYLKELKVNHFRHNYSLYQLGLFPQQGVELLKALLAYYFAFNKLIMKTSYAHRLPLVLDAVFKEDVDGTSKDLIIEFISNHIPTDTQLIFSIAESEDKQLMVDSYNTTYFENKAKIITINKSKERAFFQPYNEIYNELKEDTYNIINS